MIPLGPLCISLVSHSMWNVDLPTAANATAFRVGIDKKHPLRFLWGRLGFLLAQQHSLVRKVTEKRILALVLGFVLGYTYNTMQTPFQDTQGLAVDSFVLYFMMYSRTPADIQKFRKLLNSIVSVSFYLGVWALCGL